jgi:hypothetical protein
MAHIINYSLLKLKVMKSTFKKTIQITVVCAMILTTAMITKRTVVNIKHLYVAEKMHTSGINAFFELVY